MKTVKTVYEIFSLQHINFDVKQISKVVLQEYETKYGWQGNVGFFGDYSEFRSPNCVLCAFSRKQQFLFLITV